MVFVPVRMCAFYQVNKVAEYDFLMVLTGDKENVAVSV